MPKKTYICDSCGKTFERYACEIKGKKRYCSHECQYKNPWNKGLKGKEYTKHYKNGFGGHKNKGNIPWNKGKINNSRYVECKKCGKLFKVYDSEIKNNHGKYCSLSCARIGNKNAEGPAWNKGLTKETDVRVLHYSGKNNGLWNGGSSFEPYGKKFNKQLKKQIYQRDGAICQICHELIWNGHAIHHIDYNKTNNKPENLILLCKSCHCKTNTNRNYWKEKLGK